MRRNAAVGLLASILFCGLAMAMVLITVSQTNGAGSSLPEAAAAVAGHQDDGTDDDELDDAVGEGPPAWTRAHGKSKHRGADKEWKEAWHKLTPAQKDAKMAALAAAHEQGMTEWTACIAAAGEDSSERSNCVKPCPPGQAKQLP